MTDLEKEARLIELYYQDHPKKLIIKSKYEIEMENVEKELGKLREHGIKIKTIKK